MHGSRATATGSSCPGGVVGPSHKCEDDVSERGITGGGVHQSNFRCHSARPRTQGAWNHNLDKKLGVLGFTRCQSEHVIYCRGGRDNRLILSNYIEMTH
jgi:hypothetical protein